MGTPSDLGMRERIACEDLRKALLGALLDKCFDWADKKPWDLHITLLAAKKIVKEYCDEMGSLPVRTSSQDRHSRRERAVQKLYKALS